MIWQQHAFYFFNLSYDQVRFLSMYFISQVTSIFMDKLAWKTAMLLFLYVTHQVLQKAALKQQNKTNKTRP